MANRGIIVPDEISLERSYFFDNRPSLFCVVKYLKDKQQKITVTYYEQGHHILDYPLISK